jgi:hypothetical protein
MAAVDYDLNEVFDALAGVFDGVDTGDEVSGVAVTLTCVPEVPGQIEPPGLVLDFDDQNYDLNFGSGADSFGLVGLLLVTYAEAEDAQRALRSFLSRKQTSGITRLKDALEANQTLGGLVSYVVLTGVRNIGIVVFSGVDYLGAELVFEVMS